RVEKAANEPRKRAALQEDLARLLAHDEVDVALPQLELLIRDAVPLLRQRPQRFHEQAQLAHVHRELAGLGLDELAARSHDVADIPLLEISVEGLAHAVAPHEQLKLPGPVLNLHEAAAAHHALDHHAAGH